MLVTQAPVHAPTNNAHQEPRAESGRIGSLTQGVDLHKDHHIDLSSLNIDLHGFPEGPLVELVTSPPLDETMPEQEIRAHMRGMRAFADDAERLSNNFRTPFPLDQIPAVATVVAQAPGNQLYIGGLLPHQHTVGYTQATFGVRTSVAPEVFREMQRDENVSAATQKEASLNRAHMDGVLRRAERVMNAVVRFVRENHDEASDQALRGLTGLRRPLEPGWTSVTSTPQRLSLDKRARRIGLPVIASPPTGWQSSPDGREYLYDRETLETLGWADEVAAAPATHYKLNRVTSTSSARPFARTLDEKLEGLEPLRGLVTMMANYLDLPFATNTDINLKNAIGQLLPKSALHTVRNAMQGYSRVLIDDPEVQGLIVDELMKGAAAGPMNMDGTLRTIVAGQGDDFHRALMSRGASQAINDQRVGPGDGESAVVIENRQLQPPGGVPSGRGIYDRLPALGDKRRWKADHLKPDEWEEVAVNLYRWLREINGYNIVGRDRSNAFSGVDEFLRRRDT
jgi:hypothetical protein